VVRPAREADLPRLAELLAPRGEFVSLGSLRARLGEESGGVLLGATATLSWTLDGGALHLYDVAGEPTAFEELLDVANALGRASFAAVLAVSVYEGDPALAALLAAGFSEDWSEADVRGGRPARLIALVREVR
jgi:hypothetical protein